MFGGITDGGDNYGDTEYCPSKLVLVGVFKTVSCTTVT